MCVCMYVCMYVGMDGWMDGWMWQLRRWQWVASMGTTFMLGDLKWIRVVSAWLSKSISHRSFFFPHQRMSRPRHPLRFACRVKPCSLICMPGQLPLNCMRNNVIYPPCFGHRTGHDQEKPLLEISAVLCPASCNTSCSRSAPDVRLPGSSFLHCHMYVIVSSFIQAFTTSNIIYIYTYIRLRT